MHQPLTKLTRLLSNDAVATQSLNGLLGSARGGLYDSQTASNKDSISSDYSAFGGWNSPAHSVAAQQWLDWPTNFQFTIDSKTYPQASHESFVTDLFP